jgi:N-acetylglucosaminyldiphosphoundecaprenol N-acetyl-beta-D-mannosaminyltransferase
MGNELKGVGLQEDIQETAVSATENDLGHVPPIFVVGVWRSGTTLFYSLLNQHPDIRLFYESDLPVLWPMFRLPWERQSWVDKWEYWNAGVSRHDLDPVRLASPVNSLAEAIELAGKTYAAEKGKRRWGCKSPSYYDRLDYLAREFPDARFIVIWRDPEEICLSVIKAAPFTEWFARPGMPRKALLASKTLKKQMDKLLEMGTAVHQIHYRDLVEHTDETMRGVCNFLRVPFDPAVTDLTRSDRSAVFEGPHHNLAKGGKIVARKESKESLPPALTRKIRRYKALWKAESGETWMLTQRFVETGDSKPGILERAVDRASLILSHLRDNVPRMIFSILPLAVWQAYRRLKYKDAQFVHRLMTKKETTLHRRSSHKQSDSNVSDSVCAVRLGKVMLHSMDIDELVSNGGNKLKHIVTVHSEIFVHAHENPEYEELLSRTVNTIDGRIVHLLCSLLYPGRKLRKLSGSDFIYNLADHAAKSGERLFLLGADAQANRDAIEVLKARNPGLAVDGYSPPFSANIREQAWNEDMLSRIATFHPAHLVVCFGPLKQEMWISQNANYLFGLGVRCAYGLGGTLDFVSGRKKRAPRLIQIVGAEWLFRAIKEPSRMGRTAKMFKMPYFALRFHKHEIGNPRRHEIGNPQTSAASESAHKHA